jgi:DNA end-binding protein Ku
MLRAIWSGSISFGLVGIPVKAVPAQSPKDIRFELLHGPCHSKTSTKRYCPQCEREASEEEMVRGFQYSKGQYVLLEPAELEALGTPAKRTIQILDFVDMADVDPVYFEKPYYLQPSEGGERTYALLHRAMQDSGRVGIGKVALREREHLALIRPCRHGLVMETIAFPDEVRSIEDAVAPIDVKIDERELQMAHLLISSMTGQFTPEKYRDEYREGLTRLIEEKVEGGTVAAKAAPAPASSSVSDLMEMLRRSVEAMQQDRTAGAPNGTPGAEAPPEPNGHHPLNGHAAREAVEVA